MRLVLHYLPRALSVVLTAFLFTFVVEGFTPGFGLMDSLAHLSLGTVVLVIAVLAWKKPLIGGAFFLAIGAYYLFLSLGRVAWWIGLLAASVPLLTGALFVADGLLPRRAAD